ncbi:hypothetical protein DL764_004667 [Monosporascus ibericus]|uniref:histone acetyltransferase n=1 Tax=Monosporascus ibericus TaxID=155417 RepID=A0A4Q4TF43_9PEZI|nr:hypothetical protein DL764_004667 [Monosporascus ibericus]
MASSRQPRDRERVAGANVLLVEELSKVLPKDTKFEAYHLSTPPTVTDALCNPPAQPKACKTESREPRPTKPLKTYCEKQFLAISIDAAKHEPVAHGRVLVLGLEVYIYTTSFSTIIFVSKADSTGYLNLLNLPKGTPSPIREVTAVFISFLVTTRRRPTKQLVVNLFARSQSQYLFPGSVKNSGKHILDDRGLVKWWCRVLNSLLEGSSDTFIRARKGWNRIHGYLVVPGLDDHEMRFFLPRPNTIATNWTLGHPLERISPYLVDPATYGQNVPPRCLIPTYPDDPKARFVEELEESTPMRVKLSSGWRTPKTLDQFWEMMAFRQECSSGRLTGFIWVVFDPSPPARPTARPSAATILTPNASFSVPNDPTTPATSQEDPTALATPSSTPSKRAAQASRTSTKKTLKGRIVPRRPQIKTHNRIKFPERIETPHYFWPETGRGQVVLDESGYNRAVELLLRLEFAKLDSAIANTARWINEVNVGTEWGLEFVGTRDPTAEPTSQDCGGGSGGGAGGINNLSGMVRKKRPAEDSPADGDRPQAAPAVNTLGAGLVRKKAKLTMTDEDSAPPPAPQQEEIAAAANVNVLGSGLVRKKAKPSET